MGVLLGLLLGVGLLLVWLSLTAPPTGSRGAGGDGTTGRLSPGRLRDLLDRAGLAGVQVRSLVALCAASGAVAFLVVQVASATPTVAAAFGLLAAYLPVAVVAGRARARQQELAELWPDAVDNLASAVRAGLSLPEALGALGERGPEALRPAFSSFAADYQASGRFGESLDRVKLRLADPVGDRVVEGLRIAREVGGGDLGRLLRNLSGHLRDDARTRGELQARQSWTVNGARLAVAAPWLVLFMMCFQRDVVSRYASTAGAVVLLAGGVVCVTAYWLMMRIGRLPTERRVLA